MTDKANKSPKAKASGEKKEEPEVELVKINKWDGSAVKHAIDDSVKLSLLKQRVPGGNGLREHFGLVDGRLFICALAVLIALVALGWDFKHPFPESKPVLIVCVGSYFVLMGILTLYTTYREKNIFAVAVDNKDPNRVYKADSEMRKYNDEYHLNLTLHRKGMNPGTVFFTRSCAKFIDNNGFVLNDVVHAEVSRLFNNLLNVK